MKKILLMNGPNLNLLGVREPGIYGSNTLADLERMVEAYGQERDVQVISFQSNHEGVLIDQLHAARDAYDGIVYNPGAHTHYSYALRDAVGGIDVPCVEVHISDVSKREDFRQVSFVRQACIATIAGHGLGGYIEAMELLKEHLTA